MRALTLALIIAMVAVPVLAQEIWTCTDTDANGFTWKEGPPRRASFAPIQFTVQVINPARRTIKFSVYPASVDYDCFTPWDEPDLSLCTSTLAKAVEPIIFRANKFERVANFAKHVNEGGKLSGLAVAYGTCVKN
jgi:hypothetical protein